MNIFKRELRTSLKGLLIWAVVIVAFCTIAYIEGQAFMDMESMSDMMDAFPEELSKAFSMDSFDLATPQGYYGLMVSYVALTLAIYSVMRGCTSIVSEERDRMVEFSLVLPIKRHRLLTSKLVVVILYGIVLNLVSIVSGLVFGNIIGAPDAYFSFVLLSSVAIFFIQLIFTAIGFCIGCLFHNHKKANSLGIGILMATYSFSIFSSFHEKLEFLRYLTPFKFFDFVEILENMKIDIVYSMISIALSAVLIAIGYIGYKKRDMQI